MNGLLLTLKPPGMTSHDVVALVRRETGEKAGHVGTLDPAAAGLLALALGPATRLSRYLTGHDKSYRAEITFGLSTDTGDAEGEITAQAEAAGLTAQAVADGLAALTGKPRLAVPVYSAVKQAGRPLHRRQRAGEQLEPPEREMRVDGWRLLEFWPGPRPVALTDLDCAAGTYVRSLVTALGEHLGVPAYLSFLVRTRLGSWRLEQARTLEEIAAAGMLNAVGELLLTPAEALADLAAFTLPEAELKRVRHGNPVFVKTGEPPGEQACILDSAGELVVVARVTSQEGGYLLQPETFLS